MEFEETLQEASTQSPLPSVCFRSVGKQRWPHWPLITSFFDRKQVLDVLYEVYVFRADRKKDGRLGLWFAEIFSHSTLQPLNGIWRNMIGSNLVIDVLFHVCVLRSMEKQRWSHWPLIGWKFYEFRVSSATLNEIANLDARSFTERADCLDDFETTKLHEIWLEASTHFSSSIIIKFCLFLWCFSQWFSQRIRQQKVARLYCVN